MARYSRLEVLNEINRLGIVPVFYNADLDIAKKIINACFDGGARVIEFTNRGDNAYRVFSDLVMYYAKRNPEIILGVGSVGDPATGALYMASGANFVVGSLFNPELAKICNRRKVAYCPGCGSATEISQAEELGVEIVKVFPAIALATQVRQEHPWPHPLDAHYADRRRGSNEESITAWSGCVAACGIGSDLLSVKTG